MSGHMGIADKDFEDFLIRFHMVREAFRREELPSDLLYQAVFQEAEVDEEGRTSLQRAYEVETQHSKRNLDQMIFTALGKDVKGRGERTLVPTGDVPEGIEALSFEYDQTSPVVHVLQDVKRAENYWKKSVGNVKKQNETGHYDHKRFRIIVELPEATAYRKRRDWSQLSPAEKREFRQQFNKRKVTELSETQREAFYAHFAKEFHQLTKKEQEEYTRRFEDGNRDLARDLATKIASLEHLDTIPIAPHFMTWGRREFRVQRQVILDEVGERTAEVEYLVSGTDGKTKSLFKQLVTRFSAKETEEGVFEYTSPAGRKGILQKKSGVITNFHFEEGADLSHQDLVDRISQRAQVAIEKYGSIEDADRRLTKSLPYIRLGMEDLPLGHYIFAETITRDLQDKYPGISFNTAKTAETFLKDRLGENAESNGYEDIKLYLSLNAVYKEISGECQIRTHRANAIAEFGSAAKKRDYRGQKKSREARDSSLTELEERLGEAFFSDDEAVRRAAQDEIHLRYFGTKIQLAAQPIYNERDLKVNNIFSQQWEDIKEAAQQAKEMMSSQGFNAIAAVLDEVYIQYTKPIDEERVENRDPFKRENDLWYLTKQYNQLSRDLGIELSSARTRNQFLEKIHELHASLIVDLFGRIEIDGTLSAAALLCTEHYLVNYHKYHMSGQNPRGLNPLMHEGIVGTVDEYRTGATVPYLNRGKFIGHVPPGYNNLHQVDPAALRGFLVDNKFTDRSVVKIMRIFKDYVAK